MVLVDKQDRLRGLAHPTARDEPTVALKELVEADLEALRDLVAERWSNHYKEHVASESSRAREAALTDKALSVAETARAEALRIAADSLSTYKSTSNEFRGTLEDQAGHFVTITVHEAALARLTALENDRIARDAAALTAQASATADRERERADRARQQWVFGIVISFVTLVLSTIVGIIVRALTA